MGSSGSWERERGYREKSLSKPRILKLGGSLITYKEKPLTVRDEVLDRVSREIEMAWSDGVKKIVIVHGGGSFGHYIASRVLEERGEIDLEGFSDIAWYMNELNREVVKSLRRYSLPAVQISTRGVVFERDRKLIINIDLIRSMIDAGLIPVLFGDVIISDARFRILSGDELAWNIAPEIEADWVLFASIIDGVYDRPPERGGSRVIRLLRVSKDLSVELGEGYGIDVTGGMRTKILSGERALARGVRGLIFNGLKHMNIYKALTGSLDQGTVIEY